VGKHLLLEIGCEELPASFVAPALAELGELARAGLAEARLASSAVRTSGTPRRLVLVAESLAERQEDRVREVLGPAVKVAFDASGNPTQAARGFAKSAGIAVEALERTKTPKGEYLLARVHDEGKSSADVLPGLVRSWALGLHFPKTMHWSGDARFARPVRWLVALLGKEILAFEAFGVRSGRLSRGHRSIAPGWFEIGEAARYDEEAGAHGVMVDPAQRRAAIEGELRRVSEAIGGTAVPDPELVDEVSNLVEWPEAVLGSFDAKYLELPRAVVVTAMRAHQRYFAIEAPGASVILPHFVMIRNGRGGDITEIRRGSQSVLRARLEDARFYWQNDLKGGLEGKLPALKGIVWHEKLGTVYDRTQRLTQLVEELARILDPRARAAASRAAYLCKADLASEMVRSGKEFASLQGIIGAEYAAKAGEPQAVVEGIRSHYLPQGPSDPLPPTVEGKLLSLADRLEAAVGGFRAGLEVSGSQDPYGLRRAGNGIVRILLETGWRLDVLEMASWLEGVFDKAGVPKAPAGGFERFWAQRMESALIEAAITPEACSAVLAVRPGDPVDLLARARAIDAIRRSPDFEGLMIGYRRAANILRSALPGDVPVSGQPMAERAEAFGEPAEADLHLETKMVRQAVETYLQASNPDYTSALKHLLGLRPSIDKFFETVMVMADDTPSRRRRLGLLEAVRQTFLRIADFAALPTAPG
jgi:glycyl-tRNA synthetase beta chain